MVFTNLSDGALWFTVTSTDSAEFQSISRVTQISKRQLSCFRDAVAQWGLPSRIRSNRGGENIDVVQYMIHRRGTGRGSALVGRCVHNQWKERLWRNVYTDVPELFKILCTVMEDRRILDSMSESDL